MVNAWHDIEIGENFPKVINAIVEIPKNSQVKYELDKKTGLIKLDRFLFSAVHYPGDYGFIPQTYWEDDDPLDIIILTGVPIYPGTLVHARVIGAMHMIDSGESDDKIIAVYDKDPRFNEFKDIKDLPKHFLDEMKHFFETYKQLQKKEVKVMEIKGRDTAYKVLEKGQKLYRDKFAK